MMNIRPLAPVPDLTDLVRTAEWCTFGTLDGGDGLGIVFERLATDPGDPEGYANVELARVQPATATQRRHVLAVLLAAGWHEFDGDDDQGWCTYSNPAVERVEH
jgi:hypothetical protein